MKELNTAQKAIFINESIARHGGKMYMIPSISTSALQNEFCNGCNGCGLASKECYAKRYLKMRPTLAAKCARNTEFYTTQKLQPEDIPTLNARFFRFESFGELENVQQLENYFTIAWQNEHVNFALWTKRPEIIEAYCKDHARPENVNIILSSPYINVSAYDHYMEKYPGLFDGVFTVYTKKYAADHNISINCHGSTGRKKCIDCGMCYSKGLYTKEGPAIIHELLK